MPSVKRKTKTVLDSYKEFKKNYPNIVISKNEYREMCCELMKEISSAVVKGNIVDLPHSLGYLWIKKFKVNLDKLPVDFKATKELGKTIRHTNIQSDGWSGRWSWYRRKALVRNLAYYSFTPSRANSRELSKEFQKSGGHTKYLTR